ncbi:SPOR domain-containing protein [Amaricoccus tamworthensis]|uniref:SPOR domain-containing protein n=1 Tax=Amaricoccus tamworthensis TaxID=57002 RepID=UPI003C7C12FA
MKSSVIPSVMVCIGLGACTVTPGGEGGPPPPAGTGGCEFLFRNYDLVEDTMSTPSGFRDRMTVQPELAFEANRLRQAGCLTNADDLAGAASLPDPAPVSGATPISPISVHAGVVTDMAVDDQAKQFFIDRGIRARSVGAAGLGRRIYLGPFDTREELDQAMDLARQAGFVAPYPARF